MKPDINPDRYKRPDFSRAPLDSAPEARFAPAPADGVLPEGFFSTTNLPTYVKLGDVWQRPTRPRMDGVLALRDNELTILEPRDVPAGTPVAMGEAEDGSEGIFVHNDPFNELVDEHGEFKFMSSDVSRERPVNYSRLARLIVEERNRGGYLLWVLGPALVHARAREDVVWMIENGFVSAVLAGNAVAVHDLEAALFGTTLGMTSEGDPTTHGHAAHMRAINVVRSAGSIEATIEKGLVKSGIMHALVKKGVPYVLGGSIRDDGPLPGVYTDNVEAQRAMREHTARTTFAILLATALHSIAVGNMLPAFVESEDDDLRPLQTLCVDQTEFVVNKLKDRGTHQAYGVVTNAQDFMQILRLNVEKWNQQQG